MLAEVNSHLFYARPVHRSLHWRHKVCAWYLATAWNINTTATSSLPQDEGSNAREAKPRQSQQTKRSREGTVQVRVSTNPLQEPRRLNSGHTSYSGAPFRLRSDNTCGQLQHSWRRSSSAADWSWRRWQHSHILQWCPLLPAKRQHVWSATTLPTTTLFACRLELGKVAAFTVRTRMDHFSWDRSRLWPFWWVTRSKARCFVRNWFRSLLWTVVLRLAQSRFKHPFVSFRPVKEIYERVSFIIFVVMLGIRKTKR